MKTYGSDFVHPQEEDKNYAKRPLTKMEHFVSTCNITWQDARSCCEIKLGKEPTAGEVMEYFASMKILYAHTLIEQLNK